MLGGDSTLASLLWMLVCVVLIIGLAYWFTRNVAGRGGFGAFQSGRHMEVLDQLPLGRDQRMVLARAGGRFLLLGVTPAGITPLAEFTEEEAAAWKQPRASEERPGFKEAFLSVLKQRERR